MSGNEELLRECFQQLKGKVAGSVDHITKERYTENLEENLAKLVKRLHRIAYIPQL